MKMLRMMSALLTILFSTSCVPLASFYPLWDQDHIADLPGLEGTWNDSEGATLVLERKKDGSFIATFGNDKESSRYELHPVILEGKCLADFYPEEASLEKRMAGEAYLSIVPAHFFAKVALEGDSMQIEVLDDEKVEKRVGLNNPAAPLLKRNDQLLLTADTKALQKLMAGLANDPAVWAEKDIFTRKKQ